MWGDAEEEEKAAEEEVEAEAEVAAGPVRK